MKLLLVFTHALAALLVSSLAAEYEWTAGGDGSSIYQEANWTLTGTATPIPLIDPNVAVNHDLIVNGGTPGGSGGSSSHLVLGTGTLTINAGTFRLASGIGIRNSTTTVNGGQLFAQFFSDNAAVICKGGTISLFGSADPINTATVAFPAGSVGMLHMVGESVASFSAEHLSKVTVAGAAAVTGSDPALAEPGDNLTIISDGGAGCFVNPVTASAINFFSVSPTVFNSGETVTLSWNVELPFTSISIDQGIGDVSTYTDGAGSGSVTFTPGATTTFTLTVDVSGSVDTEEATATLSSPPDVRINELMASNLLTIEDADGDASDWIELKNFGGSAADLTGFYLTDNAADLTQWALPNVTLEPGELLLIWASGKNRIDPSADLHTNFKLSSGGEYLALIAPNGSTVVSEISPAYPSLPVDVSYGLSPVNGTVSLYFSSPTPDAENTGGSGDLGPLIQNALTTLPMPNRTPGNGPLDDVAAISARITATTDPLSSVTLFYRIMFAAESSVTMRDDGVAPDLIAGDGTYTAAMPLTGLPEAQMIRWRIVAEDSDGTTSQMPAFSDPVQSPEYFGTVAQLPAGSTNLPVIHWFVQNPAAAETEPGTRASCYFNGEFYDNFFVRVRGGSTRSLAKKSFKFDMNPGYHFRWREGEYRAEEFNLNTTATDKSYSRMVLSHEVYDMAGSPGPEAFPLRLQQNGVFFSVTAYIEQPDKRLLSREARVDDKGAFYKMFNTGTSGTTGVEKKNRVLEGNSDLVALLAGLNGLSGTALDNFIMDNIDIPRQLNYLAATVLVQNNDQMSKNYYLYRDSDGSGEWFMMPWDLDLTFGHHYMTRDNIRGDINWANKDYVLGGAAANAPISPSHPFVGVQAYPANRSWNRMIDALLESPRFKNMYRRRLRTVMEDILQADSTPLGSRMIENRLDALAMEIGNDATLDFNKWGSYLTPYTMPQEIQRIKTEYLNLRRPHLFDTHLAANVASYSIPNSLSAELPGSQPSSPNITFGASDSSPVSGNQDEEFIELVNNESVAVDISNWSLADGVSHRFLPGTVILPGESLFVARSSKAFRTRAISPKGGEGLLVQGNYNGQLSSRGETVTLLNASDALVDTLTTAPNPSILQNDLRITELHFAPAGGQTLEFIELRNTGTTLLNLTNVYFSDGIDFTFPPGTTLSAGSFGLLVSNIVDFEAHYGNALPVLGVYTGALNSGGEQLTLRDAAGENILSFNYQGTWFPPANGGGHTIEIRDDSLSWDSWDSPLSWQVSCEIDGTPGAANSAEAGQIIEAWQREQFTEAQLADPLYSGPAADPDGDKIINLLEYALGSNPGAPSLQSLPALGESNGSPTLTFRRLRKSLDLIYTPEVSVNLQDWTPITDPPVTDPVDNNDGTESVTVKAPDILAGSNKIFLRLRVQEL